MRLERLVSALTVAATLFGCGEAFAAREKGRREPGARQGKGDGAADRPGADHRDFGSAHRGVAAGGRTKMRTGVVDIGFPKSRQLNRRGVPLGVALSGSSARSAARLKPALLAL